ncbi:MAG: Rrf2 family transcriptional regulator [Reichenbachiella sp.]
MFSKTCQYALQAILYLGVKTIEVKAVGLKEIAASQDIPSHFLSKILQDLVKRGILKSIKGPNGGFSFKKSPKQLKLIKIVELIDGPGIWDKCGIGLKSCSDENPCPIHHKYKLLKADIKVMLTEKNVTELALDITEGAAIINYIR